MSQSSYRAPILRTGRALLRPFKPADAADLLLVFQDPAVRRYLLDDQLVSASWVKAEIAASQLRFDNGEAGLWTVVLRDDPSTIIGFAGFRPFFEPPRLQLLYGMLPHCWGKGLATECAARVCEFALQDLGFREVLAAVDVPNGRSAKVLIRLGMSLERTTSEGLAGTAFYRVDRASWQGIGGASVDGT